jgi:hypothetical protein
MREKINEKRTAVVDLLIAYKHYIGLFAILVAVGIALGVIPTESLLAILDKIPTSWDEIPRGLRIVIVTLLGAGLVTALLYFVLDSLGIIDFFVEPDWVDVYEVDSARKVNPQSEPDEFIAHYKVGPEAWEHREIQEGDIYHSDFGHYSARRISLDGFVMKMKGLWAGEISDIELIADRFKIESLRGKFRTWAVIGQNLYFKLPTIAQAIESEYWQAMTNEDLDDSTLHPDIVRTGIVDEIDIFVDSVETPEVDEVDEMIDEITEDADTDSPDPDITGDEQ